VRRTADRPYDDRKDEILITGRAACVLRRICRRRFVHFIEIYYEMISGFNTGTGRAWWSVSTDVLRTVVHNNAVIYGRRCHVSCETSDD